MSYAAIDWAMPKVIKDVNAKSCLVVLAYHHNKETGLCCPSISTIADEMGVRSLNTVRKAIGVLVEMNLLTMSREFGDRGEILSTRYTLNLQSEAFKPVRKKKGVVHDMKEGGSPNEGGVVHLVQGGSSSHEGGVVHMVNPNKEVEQGKEQITGTEKETGNSLPKSLSGKQRTRGLDSQSQNSQTTGKLSLSRKNLTLILSVSLKTSTTTGTDYQERRQSKRTGRPHGETSSEASTTLKTGNVDRCSNVHLLTHLLDPVSSSRKNNPNVTTLTGKQ